MTKFNLEPKEDSENSVAKDALSIIDKIFVMKNHLIDFCYEHQQFEDSRGLASSPNDMLNKVIKLNQDRFAYRLVKLIESHEKTDLVDGLVAFNDSFLYQDENLLHVVTKYSKIFIISRIDHWVRHRNKIIEIFAIHRKFRHEGITKHFTALEHLYVLYYTDNEGFLMTVDRFGENECHEINIKSQQLFYGSKKYLRRDFVIPDKFINFHKCFLTISDSNNPGMKLLTALVDGIAKKCNATLRIIQNADSYAVYFPNFQFIVNGTKDKVFSSSYVFPDKKPFIMHETDER
jgi:hypothetical protein